MKSLELWIPHPATQGGPVSFRRWLAWHIGEKLGEWARRLERFALYPDGIPF